ncbi:hypothetical protein BCR34DRAFT_576409 [Clohesyomyces aquaticus]|uniref:MARVEL domain-containing protein n=1 Tax=Clohesyomyces aquaticus TaxID=1231657 RepID=A0A1Y1YNL1_9PLEO|nr:hypothetical protein BCR34DRAFT_576409 [Clohesyomyces aquaticus]
MSRSRDCDSPAPNRDLGAQMIRTLGAFQAIVSFPIGLLLGFFTFMRLLDSWYDYYGWYYYFITDLINGLMALGITFVVVVQRRVALDKTKTLMFEGVKYGLATAMWLWLLMDSLFGPWTHSDYRVPERRRQRVAYAVTAVVPLVLLFYTSLAYAYVQWNQERKYGSVNEEVEAGGDNPDRGEEEPLLPGRA